MIFNVFRCIFSHRDLNESFYGDDETAKPVRKARRLRNAGRAYMEHDNTCQWIQHMMEPSPHLKQSKDVKGNNFAVKGNVVHGNKQTLTGEKYM